MRVTYDKSSDAAYIEFDQEVNESLEYDHIDGEWPVNVNVSKTGKVMGIEIMNASELMNTAYLEQASKPTKTKVQTYLNQKNRPNN